MSGRLATRRRLRWIVAGILVAHWAVSWAAIAAVESSAPDLLALPWMQAAIGVGIAVGAGLTSSLLRLAASKATKNEIEFRVGLEFGKDAAAAACVGIICYYVGWTHGVPAPLLAAYLVIGGFGATRLLTLTLALVERKLRLRTEQTQPGDLT